jgi:hypothetical protein
MSKSSHAKKHAKALAKYKNTMLGYMRDGTLMPVLCVGVHSQAL